MSGDIFGSLREWGRVPAQIAELRAAGQLDEHQQGLLRILRYRDNWRLRELVLRCVKDLATPSPELLAEVLHIATSDEFHFEVRILAANALRDVLTHDGRVRRSGGDAIVEEVVEGMKRVLESPQQPVVHQAARCCLAAMGNGL